MNADRSHEPMYICSLVEAIQAGADIAIASRFPDGGGQKGVTADRKWLSKVANVLFRFFFPLSNNVREYTCGYRAYRASIIQRALALYGGSFIQLRSLGFWLHLGETSEAGIDRRQNRRGAICFAL